MLLIFIFHDFIVPDEYYLGSLTELIAQISSVSIASQLAVLYCRKEMISHLTLQTPVV